MCFCKRFKVTLIILALKLEQIALCTHHLEHVNFERIVECNLLKIPENRLRNFINCLNITIHNFNIVA